MLEFHKMAIKLVMLILLNVFVAENAALHRCPKSKIACFCGELPNGDVKFFDIQPEFVDEESEDCFELSLEICASHSCFFNPTDEFNSEAYVKKRALKNDSLQTVNISLPTVDGGAKESHHMPNNHRFAQKCSLPQIEHAAMDCHAWDQYYRCDIRCHRGYAFEEDGKMMFKAQRVCQESEGVWLPKNNFPHCKPYINCEAILVKPGTLTCYPGPEITYCEISCKMDYENGYGAVPTERYDCLDEHFAEYLPHCATVETKVDLFKLSAKRPKRVPKPV